MSKLDTSYMDKWLPQQTEDEKSESSGLLEVSVDDLIPFHTGGGHPFDVEEDADMLALMEKIRAYGILEPILVRKDANLSGRYEIIAGHRRHYCAKKLDIPKVKVYVADYDDDMAIIAMVETNVGKRERIKPSNLARAYKMYMEANSHQGKRSDLTSDTGGQKLLTVEMAAEKFSVGTTTIKRYVRLNELIPELLTMMDEVDEKSKALVGIKVGEQISYLQPENQKLLYDKMVAGCIPTEEQAKNLRELEGTGFAQAMDSVFSTKADSKPKAEKKAPSPKLNEKFVNTYLIPSMRKIDVEKKQQFVQEALTRYNQYLAEHPEELAQWTDGITS